MNIRPKSKMARLAEALALGLLPLTCVTALCSIALVAGHNHDRHAATSTRHYDMVRLAADARQVAALIHYLTEIEPPVSTQHLAQSIKAPQPLLTQSNYTLLLTTNRANPI